jgi:hypothetical protein
VWRSKVAVVAPTNYAFALDERGSAVGSWDSEQEIPEELHDTALTPFDAAEGEIVSVFQDSDDEEDE